jgi:DNA repair exonuclease SbcCD ATPase subunit
MGSTQVTDVRDATGEDMLLQQIDAFREKAKQIQNLLVAKERRVKELEAMVQDKERRNAQLQEELNEKQKEADGLVKDVQTQVDRAMKEIRQAVDEMEVRVSRQVSDNQQVAAAETRSLQNAVDELTNCLDKVKGELSEKVHTENVKQYRNIQDLLKEMDNQEEAISKNEAGFSGIKGRATFISFLIIANIIVTVCMWLSMIGIL